MDRVGIKKIHYFNSFIIFFCPLHIHSFFPMDMFYRWLHSKQITFNTLIIRDLNQPAFPQEELFSKNIYLYCF